MPQPNARPPGLEGGGFSGDRPCRFPDFLLALAGFFFLLCNPSRLSLAWHSAEASTGVKEVAIRRCNGLSQAGQRWPARSQRTPASLPAYYTAPSCQARIRQCPPRPAHGWSVVRYSWVSLLRKLMMRGPASMLANRAGSTRDNLLSASQMRINPRSGGTDQTAGFVVLKGEASQPWRRYRRPRCAVGGRPWDHAS